MDIKIDLNGETAEKLIEEGMQQKILAGAVGYIIQELTPDRLQAWIFTVFSEAMRNFSSYKTEQKIREMAEPMLEQAIQTPEIKERIRVSMQQGVEEAIGALPERIKTQLIQSAVKSLEANIIRGR